MTHHYRLTLSALILFVSAAVTAHGDLALRIAALTEQLQADGETTELLMKRGELYRQHGEWQPALDDLSQAAELDPGNNNILFFSGRVLYQSGQYAESLKSLLHYLKSDPEHSACLLYTARAYAALHKSSEASNYYKKALNNSAVRTPDLYLEWAEAHYAQRAAHLSAAVEILQQGIEDLGPLVTLVQRAIEYDLLAGDGHLALQHLELLPPTLKKTPKWLTAKADLLNTLHERQSAQQTYHTALEAIERLPRSRRETPAMLDLGRYLSLQIGDKK